MPIGFDVRVAVICNEFNKNYRELELVNGSFDAPNPFSLIVDIVCLIITIYFMCLWWPVRP